MASNQAVRSESALAVPSQLARLDGYPSFAQFIATYDAAIYRKYAHLSARNLLYFQSELHELEAQLQQLDLEDAEDINNEKAQQVAHQWSHYADPDNETADRHRLLQGKIRIKLKEYRTHSSPLRAVSRLIDDSNRESTAARTSSNVFGPTIISEFQGIQEVVQFEYCPSTLG